MHAMQEALEDALKSPAGDPIPHPALDVHPTSREAERGLDKVVFGIAAAVALGFSCGACPAQAR
jgi:hypothetical protein